MRHSAELETNQSAALTREDFQDEPPPFPNDPLPSGGAFPSSVSSSSLNSPRYCRVPDKSRLPPSNAVRSEEEEWREADGREYLATISVRDGARRSTRRFLFFSLGLPVRWTVLFARRNCHTSKARIGIARQTLCSCRFLPSGKWRATSDVRLNLRITAESQQAGRNSIFSLRANESR